MEKVPIPKIETEEITFDELATALEEVIITIKECKHNIAEAEKFLETNQKEYDDLVSMLDDNDPEDKAELEKMKGMQKEYDVSYRESLFAVKPILFAAEGDDARPTVIKTHTTEPYFISVLSGKISTIYDLDNII